MNLPSKGLGVKFFFLKFWGEALGIRTEGAKHLRWLVKEDREASSTLLLLPHLRAAMLQKNAG